MLTHYALLALPMAVVWVILTSQVSVWSFGIGYVISFAIALLLSRSRETPLNINPAKLPGQIGATIIYTALLARDILLAGIDVSLRVLGVRPLNPGIVAVPTQDEKERDIIGGLSAHGITITPGELVVDFSEDGETMYVHMLDVDSFEPELAPDQARRLKFFRSMLGYD
jgi:multicomponent Na+:H+ antiporter subunit E